MKAAFTRALWLALSLGLTTAALAQEDGARMRRAPGPVNEENPFRQPDMPTFADAMRPNLAAPAPAVRRLNRVDCSVVGWEHQTEVPVLRLLCPSEKVFAPLRLILRVTWSDKEKMPKEAAHILTKPREQARLMFSEADREWRVSLDVRRDNGKTERRWITFNDVIGTRIVSEQ